ncbi:MAG: hypothetical protein HY558_06965 [Euryarchaeota archaeon]|nr:hypothetical protein [Euryarchaeota archaeon]
MTDRLPQEATPHLAPYPLCELCRKPIRKTTTTWDKHEEAVHHFMRAHRKTKDEAVLLAMRHGVE